MRLPPPAMVNGTCEGPAVAGASQLGRSSNRLRAQRRSLMARVQAQLCVRLIAVVSGAGACPPMPGGRSPLLHHPLSLSNVCWSARPGERFNHTVVFIRNDIQRITSDYDGCVPPSAQLLSPSNKQPLYAIQHQLMLVRPLQRRSSPTQLSCILARLLWCSCHEYLQFGAN
jgi:hypothetical protein